MHRVVERSGPADTANVAKPLRGTGHFLSMLPPTAKERPHLVRPTIFFPGRASGSFLLPRFCGSVTGRHQTSQHMPLTRRPRFSIFSVMEANRDRHTRGKGTFERERGYGGFWLSPGASPGKAGYVRRHFNSVVGTAASPEVCRTCAGGFAGKQVTGDHRLRREAIGRELFFLHGERSVSPRSSR